MSTVQDQLDRDFAPGWKPKAGDKLVGVVVDVTERDGSYGRYPIVTIRVEDGDELAVHAFHEVLQSELAKVAPKPGDELGIAYLGKHEERGYHRYRVARAGGTATVAWGDYSGAGTDDADETTGPPASDVPADLADLDTTPARSDDDRIPF